MFIAYKYTKLVKFKKRQNGFLLLKNNGIEKVTNIL